MPKKVISPIGEQKKLERVLVVKRSEIFADGTWNGLKTDNLSRYIKIISTSYKFLPRSKVEEDPHWQQIIPYLVFKYSRKFFLMKRKSTHTDKRLANMYSIGVGGHINEKDLRGIMGVSAKGWSSFGRKSTKSTRGSDIILEWAKREFEEEIDYRSRAKTEFLGLINDDSNDVGMVHLGAVIIIRGDSDKISVKDEHKYGELASLEKVGKYYKRMETWSRMIYDFLNTEREQMRQRSSSIKLRTSQKDNNISGILPDWLIKKYIEAGVIKISPLAKNWKKDIDQVSVDFHLSGKLKLFKAGAYRFIDTRRGLPTDAMEEVNLSEGDPFILEPGAFAIASTFEVLKLPGDILGRLEGKSSLARLGILVHSTAARFDPGWNGAPVLELGNLGPKPAILYCGMSICAFTFEKLAVPVSMPYEGSRSDRYSGSKIPVASKIEKYVRKNK